MSDPITNFMNGVREATRHNPLVTPEQTASLERVLRSHIDWKDADDRKDEIPFETNAVRVSHFWQADVDGWHLVLADFPIGDQPGRKPLDRGQNIAISGPICLFGDGEANHKLAQHLVLQLRAQGLAKALCVPADTFKGGGNVPGLRIQHMKQSQEYTINSPERLNDAITWMEQHIKRLGDTVWIFERDHSIHYQFDQATKVALWWGNFDRTTNMVLEGMGWKVVRREPGGKQN